jgi:hypothetical protein
MSRTCCVISAAASCGLSPSCPDPTARGLDEVSIRKGHTYRIVVSDLLRQRPIWFGGTDRSEASLDQFYAWLGPPESGPAPGTSTVILSPRNS